MYSCYALGVRLFLLDSRSEWGKLQKQSTTRGKAAFEVHHKLNTNSKRLQSTPNLTSAGMECNWSMCFLRKNINCIVTLCARGYLPAVPTHISCNFLQACTEQDFDNDRTQLVAFQRQTTQLNQALELQSEMVQCS